MAGLNMKIYKVKKILNKNGWVYDRNSGDHLIFVKDSKHISIPNHPNGMILQRLFREMILNIDSVYNVLYNVLILKGGMIHEKLR